MYRRGSGGDPATLYRDYLGHDAKPDALLRDAGITGPDANADAKANDNAAVKPKRAAPK